MASAAQWPERWTHSYSGTAELISHSHEGLHGSLFLHLRGQGAGEGEGKKKYRWEKRRRNTRGKRKKDTQLKVPCLEDPGCLSPLSFLSIVSIFRCHPPLHMAACTQGKAWECCPGHHAHLSLWQVHNWPVSDFSDSDVDGTWSNLACCKQIRLLKIGWEAVRSMVSKIQKIVSLIGSSATQQALVSPFPWPQLLSPHTSREICPRFVTRRDLLELIMPDNCAFAKRINTRHAQDPSVFLEFLYTSSKWLSSWNIY